MHRYSVKRLETAKTTTMKKYLSSFAALSLFLGASFLTSFMSSTSFLAVGTLTGTVTETSTGEEIPFATITIEGTSLATISDIEGKFEIEGIPVGKVTVRIASVGYQEHVSKDVVIKDGETTVHNIGLRPAIMQLDEVEIVEDAPEPVLMHTPGIVTHKAETLSRADRKAIRSSNAGVYNYAPTAIMGGSSDYDGYSESGFNTEEYDNITENEFKEAISNPLSTFSIDVDNASYSNVRRFLNMSQMPVADAVRIEEMVNYFTYDYEDPQGDVPFTVYTEMSDCPWNDEARLVHIGLQGKKVDYEDLNPSNLVFLLDVSGSMNHATKLPLVKESLMKLVDELDAQDRVAIAVYAGAAGLVLPSTPASNKSAIKDALKNLSAGGSTAGGAGIRLAYKVAQENFIEDGNNRIILVTDGDFNVGASSDAELVKLIEEKRKSDVFLTVCGFGMGNYKDSKMEKLADKGNGNYFYIDSEKEAEKVFVKEMRATLFTIAKDVKIQVEFNPARVASYRLVGYENRLLNKEDFDDDTKDAGELGAGHTVTAMYEIIPTKTIDADNQIDPGNTGAQESTSEDLRYTQTRVKPEAYELDEIMVVKLRYKQPTGSVSKLIEKPLPNTYMKLDRSSDNFRWAAAVAEFGMLLRDSKFKGDADYAEVLDLARAAQGTDTEGYRAEFIGLVRSCMKVVASK